MFKKIIIAIITLNSFIYNGLADEINVMSFNIRYGTADDGANSWKYRKDMLLGYLQRQDMDLIGLQEVLKFQLDEIMDALPGYEMIGVSRLGNFEDEFSAILYKKSRFIPKKTDTYWLSDTSGVPSNGWGNDIFRIVTWAEFKDVQDDKSFYLYNAHFDHRSQISREKGAEQLIEQINTRDHGYPVVITGDFNAGESNAAIRHILSNGIIDTFRVIHPNETIVGTFNGFTGDNSGEKIDHVFVGAGIDINDAKIDTFNINGKYPSDHYPVTANITLK